MRRFITARHVLTECGCPAGATTFDAFLCDDKRFSESVFELTNFTWECDCDYAEFDCLFPGDPYIANPAMIQKGAAIRTSGFVRRAGVTGDMPGCDRPQPFDGTITGINQDCCASGKRFVEVTLQIGDPSPSGLSGSPVISIQTGEVLSVFCGGPNQLNKRFAGPEVGK